MLENLTQQPPDKIIMLSGMFRADERTDKIDLGVGVYKDANGNTPIMRAVKKAEQLLWNEETTKSYTALVGDGAFHKVMADLVLGDSVAADRLAFAHAPGGTGAIRQILELIKVASPMQRSGCRTRRGQTTLRWSKALAYRCRPTRIWIWKPAPLILTA